MQKFLVWNSCAKCQQSDHLIWLLLNSITCKLFLTIKEHECPRFWAYIISTESCGNVDLGTSTMRTLTSMLACLYSPSMATMMIQQAWCVSMLTSSTIRLIFLFLGIDTFLFPYCLLQWIPGTKSVVISPIMLCKENRDPVILMLVVLCRIICQQ